MQDVSVYLGAAPIVECLEKYRPNVVITTRVADAALFLGPMVWAWVAYLQYPDLPTFLSLETKFMLLLIILRMLTGIKQN